MDEGRTSTNGRENKKTNDDAHGLVHPRDDTHRLYMSRKEGELLKITSMHLNDDSKTLQKRAKKDIPATRNNTSKTSIDGTTITRKRKKEEKQQCGYFKQQTNEISREEFWTWQRKGNFKRETMPTMFK